MLVGTVAVCIACASYFRRPAVIHPPVVIVFVEGDAGKPEVDNLLGHRVVEVVVVDVRMLCGG